MSVDAVSNSNKTVDIFYSPKALGNGYLNGGFHVREKGKQGFPLMLGDSSYKTTEDVLKTAQRFLNEGYEIENIRINGQPITDKFQKGKDGKYEPIVRHSGDTFVSSKTSNNAKGKVSTVFDHPFISQVVTTPSGREVYIPTTVGVRTIIKPLSDGTYELKIQTGYDSKQTTSKIITEKELIQKYGDYKLQIEKTPVIRGVSKLFA